jgi:hypothetical protein
LGVVGMVAPDRDAGPTGCRYGFGCFIDGAGQCVVARLRRPAGHINGAAMAAERHRNTAPLLAPVTMAMGLVLLIDHPGDWGWGYEQP